MGVGSQTGLRSILLNGRSKDVAAVTLEELLDEMGHDPLRKGIAVALNGEVVPRGRWGDTGLSSGDAVEIVGAVQGG
jgi:sulfur carrier protein